MSESPEQEFLKRVEESVGKIFDELVMSVDTQFRLLEQRVDAQDIILAELMKAYTQMNLALEGTIAEVMSPRTDKEREEFRKELNRRHVDMLRQMSEVARAVEGDSEEDPTASILRMVGQDPDRPPFGERSESAGDGPQADTDGIESGDGNEASWSSSPDPS